MPEIKTIIDLDLTSLHKQAVKDKPPVGMIDMVGMSFAHPYGEMRTLMVYDPFYDQQNPHHPRKTS